MAQDPSVPVTKNLGIALGPPRPAHYDSGAGGWPAGIADAIAALDAAIGGGGSGVVAERVVYTVTADDVSANFFQVDLPWPAPFADTDYTATVGISIAAINTDKDATLSQFQKFVDKLTVVVDVDNSEEGDVWTVEAIAVHD